MLQVLQWLSVIGLGALRVLPALGLAMTYNFSGPEIFISLSIGGILGIVFFTFFGVRIRRWRKARRMRLGHTKPLKIRRARRMKRLWNKFGIIGIALLTPPMISPPLGALIAVFFNERPARIYLFMFLSVFLWSAVFALVGQQILDLIAL
jgi:uncharacterized membrane protein